MKKIIIKVICFLIILFFILFILSKIFEPKNNTKQAGIPKNRILQTGILAEPKNTLDVIIVGNSEAYTSFIPLEAWHEYGYTSYVCGTPGQKLPSICSILYEALKNQNPKIVLLEADTIYKRTSLFLPVEHVISNIFPVFQYHNRWKSLNKEDFGKDVNYRKIRESKGFYYSDIIKKGKNKEYMEETEEV